MQYFFMSNSFEDGTLRKLSPRQGAGREEMSLRGLAAFAVDGEVMCGKSWGD